MSPRVPRTFLTAVLVLVAPAVLLGCGDDDPTEADAFGVGATCAVMADCLQPDPPCDGGAGCFPQQCLTQFAGGYCGIADCTSHAECPEGSACVTHDDGHNYCFRRCDDKSECNVNRDADHESNCSANVVFVEPTSGKACVPPSSGP